MLAPLRRLFAPDPFPNLAEELRALQGRVRALEAERLEVMTEWVKTRDQVLRYMKRAGAIRATLEKQAPQLDPEQDDDEGDEIDELIFRRKTGG